jgi:hypothetical protein
MPTIIDVRDPYLAFTPPEREKEPATVRCFINFFPDLSSAFNFPFLNFIPFYNNLVEHIDSVGILTVIISVSLTAISAIGIFFINIAAVEITLFALQFICGSIAILSTGAYIKRYYLLKRNHKEVEILERYSQALNRQISLFEDEILEMNISLDSLSKASSDLKKENADLANTNTKLNLSISKIKAMAEEISLSNAKLTEENVKFSTATLTLKKQILEQNLQNTKLSSSNDFLKKTAEQLEQTALKAQDSYTQLFEEFNNFKNANIVLAQILALANKEREQLAKIVNQGAAIKEQTEILKTTLKNHEEYLKQIQESIITNKEELKKVTDELKDAASKISDLIP